MARDLRLALGRNVQRLRRDHCLSQEAFAEKTGIHRTYVGGIEHGARNVTLETVSRIAAAFDVDPVDLLR